VKECEEGTIMVKQDSYMEPNMLAPCFKSDHCDLIILVALLVLWLNHQNVMWCILIYIIDQMHQFLLTNLSISYKKNSYMLIRNTFFVQLIPLRISMHNFEFKYL